MAAELLARNGFGEKEVAERLEVHPSTVSRWINSRGTRYARTSRKEGVHLASLEMRGVTHKRGLGRKIDVSPEENRKEWMESVIRKAKVLAPERPQASPQEIRLLYLKKRHRLTKARILRDRDHYGPLKDRLSHEWYQAQAAIKAQTFVCPTEED